MASYLAAKPHTHARTVCVSVCSNEPMVICIIIVITALSPKMKIKCYFHFIPFLFVNSIHKQKSIAFATVIIINIINGVMRVNSSYFFLSFSSQRFNFHTFMCLFLFGFCFYLSAHKSRSMRARAIALTRTYYHLFSLLLYYILIYVATREQANDQPTQRRVY